MTDEQKIDAWIGTKYYRHPVVGECRHQCTTDPPEKPPWGWYEGTTRESEWTEITASEFFSRRHVGVTIPWLKPYGIQPMLDRCEELLWKWEFRSMHPDHRQDNPPRCCRCTIAIDNIERGDFFGMTLSEALTSAIVAMIEVTK